MVVHSHVLVEPYAKVSHRGYRCNHSVTYSDTLNVDIS